MLTELNDINKKILGFLFLMPLLCALFFCIVVVMRGDQYKVDYTLMVGSRYPEISVTLQKESVFIQLAQEANIPYSVLKNSMNYALDQRNQAVNIVINNSNQVLAEKIAIAIQKKLTDFALMNQNSLQKIELIKEHKANYQLSLDSIVPIKSIDNNVLMQVSHLATIGAATNALVFDNNLSLSFNLFADNSVNINEGNMMNEVTRATKSILKNLAEHNNISYAVLDNVYNTYFYLAMIKNSDDKIAQLEKLQKKQENLVLGSLSAYQQKISLIKCFLVTYIFVFAMCVFAVFAKRVMLSSKEY